MTASFIGTVRLRNRRRAVALHGPAEAGRYVDERRAAQDPIPPNSLAANLSSPHSYRSIRRTGHARPVRSRRFIPEPILRLSILHMAGGNCSRQRPVWIWTGCILPLTDCAICARLVKPNVSKLAVPARWYHCSVHHAFAGPSSDSLPQRHRSAELR